MSDRAVPSVVALAADCLTPGENEPLALSAVGRDRLEAKIRDLVDAEDLIPSMIGLVRFAVFVGEEERSPDAAQAILDLAASIVTPELERRTESVQPDFRHLERTLGGSGERRAPGVDAPRPDSSLRVTQLSGPPKRFRP